MKGTNTTSRLTADGAVGPSGGRIRVWNVELLSGGTAGNIVLRNGTAATDNIQLDQPGTASDTKTFNWANGLLFTAGCFYDHDANNTAAYITWESEIS